MITSWIAGRPILGFLVFSHGWTFGWWALAGAMALTDAGTIWVGSAAVALYIGGAGVFIGGVAMTAMHFGRAGLVDLGRRIVDPRPISPVWWVFILLFFPLLTLVAAVVAGLMGLDARIAAVGDFAARAGDLPAFLALLGFLLLIGPLPEEIGWRGYLLDRLLAARSAVVASLVVVVIRWSWHLPLPWLPGYFDAFAREPPGPLAMLVSLVPTTILYTWLFLNTRRSVLAAILFHWVGNLTGQILLPSDDVRLVRLVMEYAVAMGVVAWWLYAQPGGPARSRGDLNQGHRFHSGLRDSSQWFRSMIATAFRGTIFKLQVTACDGSEQAQVVKSEQVRSGYC